MPTAEQFGDDDIEQDDVGAPDGFTVICDACQKPAVVHMLVEGWGFECRACRVRGRLD